VNKSLYDKEIEFPRNMREHMRVSLGKVGDVDKDSEGYKRNQELQGKKFISYKQLKRIKNFFDNFKGNQKEKEFILNGGHLMKNFVNDELRKMREFGHMTKRNKMDAGMQNQFIKPHEKKNFNNVRPSQEHSKTVDKYNAAVTESLRRINEIMKKI
jgi:hypothetical protein